MLRGLSSVLAFSLALVLPVSCHKAVPLVPGGGPAVPEGEGGPEEARSVAERVEALDREAGTYLAAVDDALWRHWTRGEPLDLAALATAHGSLFEAPALEALRRAQALGVERRRAAHLERWVLGERLSRALASETEAIASLEAGATFTVEEREVAWRDLSRLLLSEPSAVKRRALAHASVAVAERLDVLLAHRDDKAEEVLAGLSAGSPLELAAATRELELEGLAATAREVLAATDAAWAAALGALSSVELKLPVEALTKADLPRLLKVPAAVDALFPRQRVAPRALDTLAGLGLYGRAGMSFELSEGATKKPLPLTVAPSPRDVRVCFKPAGGLKDQARLLSELGVALALSAASTGHASTDRLGDPARAQALGRLLGGLLTEPSWLASVGVGEADQPAILRTARALGLYEVRRAAMGVLLHAETVGLGEQEARAAAVALQRRVLGVKVPAEEGASVRLELDDGLRSGTTLKAALLAAEERGRLGERFWASADAGQRLLARWAPGTSTSAAPSAGAVEALCRALGVSPAPPALSPTPVLTPAPGPVDTPADGGAGPRG